MGDIEIKENLGYQKLLQKIVPQSHYIDIRVRLNGKYYWFEGDFLKNLLEYFNFTQTQGGEPPKIESLEQIGYEIVQIHNSKSNEIEVVLRDDKEDLVYAGNLVRQDYKKYT